jgi:spermidine/putrescine transport system ATP-binding protein
MATLDLIKLTKRFGDLTAVDSIDLSVADGEMIALLGGSGCGKTTTLRMIAGFTEPTSGTILVDGGDVGKIPPYRRNIGIFFQNYALFPHMTVFENIAFGLKMQKMPKEKIRERVNEYLALVKLVGLEKRYPREISGGQQQRVALARALVTCPSIFLLDEPLSNLDAKLRSEMQVEIKRIQQELRITTIIVTHDQEEAVSLAERIAVMDAGRILQIDRPKEVFERPVSAFVADFMGFSTFIEGVVADGGSDDYGLILCGKRQVFVEKSELAGKDPGTPVTVGIRAENIELGPGDVNAFSGKAASVTYKGHSTRLAVTGCFDETVFAAPAVYSGGGAGEQVTVTLPPRHIRVFDRDADLSGILSGT